MKERISNEPETGKIANWNLPNGTERRKSPIEQLLERHNLGHLSQNIAQNSQTVGQVQSTPAGQAAAGHLRNGQYQSALGITPTTLQSLYANPVFHQSLRTSVLQSRGVNPGTLPLLLPQQNTQSMLSNSQPKVMNVRTLIVVVRPNNR